MFGEGERWREQVMLWPWLNVNIVLDSMGHVLMPSLGMPLTLDLASGPSMFNIFLHLFVGLNYHKHQGEYTKPTFPGGPIPKILMRNVSVIVLGCGRWF